MTTVDFEERHSRINEFTRELRSLCELEEGVDEDNDSESHRIVRWSLYRLLLERADGWIDITWLRAPFDDEGDIEAGVS